MNGAAAVNRLTMAFQRLVFPLFLVCLALSLLGVSVKWLTLVVLVAVAVTMTWIAWPRGAEGP